MRPERTLGTVVSLRAPTAGVHAASTGIAQPRAVRNVRAGRSASAMSRDGVRTRRTREDVRGLIVFAIDRISFGGGGLERT
jgi:hypothetical protein